MSSEKDVKGTPIGGILKARSPRITPSPVIKEKSRYERARSRASLDNVLQAAREFFARIPAPTKGVKPGIEEFFAEHGYSIKMSYKDATDALYATPKATGPCDDEDDDEDEDGQDIYGLFVVNDDAIPTRGIIIDAVDNFKVLVRPLPEPVCDEGAIRFCLNDLDHYDVYPAVDGTFVSLYYVARFNTWLLSTLGSFDASSYKWIGPKTYMEAFKESAGDLNFGTLDKSCVYSFIFRHHDFHPFVADPQGIWQLQGPPIAGIRQYGPFAPNAAPNAATMRFNAQKSFTDFAQSRAICYGYILRRRASADDISEIGTGPQAVYLESSLHAFIRKQMYDLPKEHAVGAKKSIHLSYDTRECFLHLRAYMSLGAKHVHLVMFPQAGEVYNKMDFIIELLTDITVAEMRAARATTDACTSASAPAHARDGSDCAIIGERLFGKSWMKVRDHIIQIGKSVAIHITSAGVMGAFGDHIHANVRDRYLSIDNMPDLLRILVMH